MDRPPLQSIAASGSDALAALLHALQPEYRENLRVLVALANERKGRHGIALGHSFARLMPSRPQMALSDIISDAFSAVAQVFPA